MGVSYEIIDDYYLFEVRDIAIGNKIIVERKRIFKYRTELERSADDVIATIKDYTGAVATSFSDQVVFEYNGDQVSVTPSAGVATLEFIVELPGTYSVKTANANVENGEVTWNE